MSNKKQEKARPSKFVWNLYVILSRIYASHKWHHTYNNEVFKKRNKDDGAIVLYNHRSMDDHFFTTATLGFDPGNYVVTNRFVFDPLKNWCFTQVGCITRDQFIADPRSILKMKRVIKEKGYIILSPAGQTSACGKEAFISKVVTKLIRLCDCDIYTIHDHGSYLCHPKWSHSKKRLYPVYSEVVKTLSKEELKTISDDELYNIICRDIDIRDYEYNKEKRIEIKCKDITNTFTDIFYRCPACGKIHTLSVNNDIISCSECGYSIRYNKFGDLELVNGKKLIFEHEPEWYLWQQAKCCDEVLKDNFSMDIKCDLYHHSKDPHKVQKEGEGILHISLNEIYYEGSLLDNKNYHHDFMIKEIIQVPYTAGSHFNIPDPLGILEFYPEDGSKVASYVQYIHGVVCYYHPEIKEELTKDVCR